MMNKKKYIILGADADYYNMVFSEVSEIRNAEYLPFIISPKKKLLSFIVKIFFSDKLRNFLPLFIKKMFYSQFYKTCPSDDEIFFIFLGSRLRYSSGGYIDYLKKKYPNGKFVLFLTDLVSKNTAFNYSSVIKDFDLIYSYDKSDSEKFNFIYQTTLFPKKKKYLIENKKNDYMLYFCGYAKDRQDLISEVANLMNIKNVTYKFYVPDMVNIADFSILTKKISYKDNIQSLQKANCILEIEQEGATGYTLRTWEAILYQKKLLTNNPLILEAPFYDSRYIRYFSNISDIDVQWLNENIDVNYASFPNSVSDFLISIENNFSIK